jgi:hypothetical protein
MRSARRASLLTAVSHPTGIFPMGLTVTCSRRGTAGAKTIVLVSRSPFDAVLLTGEVTLAIENPRAASYGDGEIVRQTVRAREPSIAAHLNGKKRCVCIARTPDHPASCIGGSHVDENSDELLKVFPVG